MRFLFAVMFMLSCLFTWAGDKKKTVVMLGIKDSRNMGRDITMTQVFFYYIPSGQFLFWDICFGTEHTVIDDFPPGQYRMVYDNVFGQKQNDTITVPPVDSFYINITTDSLPSYRASMINQLKKGERIEITFNEKGCSHHSDMHLVIKRKKERLEASLYITNIKPLIRLSRKSSGKLLHRTILNDTHIAAYTRFENELMTLNTAQLGCTTEQLYQLSAPYLHISKLDAGCQWNGSHFLLWVLFKDPRL